MQLLLLHEFILSNTAKMLPNNIDRNLQHDANSGYAKAVLLGENATGVIND
jgi:hypothetical protein